MTRYILAPLQLIYVHMLYDLNLYNIPDIFVTMYSVLHTLNNNVSLILLYTGYNVDITRTSGNLCHSIYQRQ